MKSNDYISITEHADRIASVTDYAIYNDYGLNIVFTNGLQLSIIDDSTATEMQFEIAIYDENNIIDPKYFDKKDNVIDVLRGCDVNKVNSYIGKISSIV